MNAFQISKHSLLSPKGIERVLESILQNRFGRNFFICWTKQLAFLTQNTANLMPKLIKHLRSRRNSMFCRKLSQITKIRHPRAGFKKMGLVREIAPTLWYRC
jgi:hypothetical protein